MWRTIGLLFLSNIFMMFAWYGHLKNLKGRSLGFAIAASWFIAFFEYCFQVPANRIGSQYLTLSQLKILQEVITLVVFAGFSVWFMGVRPTMNLVWAGLCLVGAAFFIFRDPVI